MFDKKPQAAEIPVAELWRMPELQVAGGTSIETGGGREKARQEGYAEGFAQGMEEGRSTAQIENSRLGQQFSDVAESMDRVLRIFDQSVAEELVTLASVMAENIVRRELNLSPEVLVDIVTRLIAEIPGSYEKISIGLSSEDAKIIREFLQQEESPLQGERWSVHEDDTLARGDCVIKTNDSVMNAEIWRQVKVMLAAAIEEMGGR